MKQRVQTIGWFTAFLCLALLWVSPAMAKEYDLWIAGEQVTDANCGDLRGIEGVTVESGGKFNYNPATKTLTMKDVTVSPVVRELPITYKVKGLKIVVSGNNRLISNGTGAPALAVQRSTFIEGDGSLYCSSGNSRWAALSLYEKTTLTISGIYFATSGDIKGASDEGKKKLILKNVGGNIDGEIKNLDEFTTEGCDIIKPEGGYFDNDKHAVVDVNGNIAKKVQIGRFLLYIAGTQVTRKNCKDLSVIDGVTLASGGEFKYEPYTETLTMRGVTVSVGDDDDAIDNGVEGLRIKVSGTNQLKATKASAFVCLASTHISGDGTLTIASTGGVGVVANSTTVTISDITLEASGKWGICGVDGTKGETLILENAKVIAKGTEAGISDLASFRTQECEIVVPVRGKFDATQHAVVDADGNIAQEVKIGKRYGLYIAGKPVTSFNCNDLSQIDDGVTVASGGEFKYDPATKTLYMKDVTVSAEGVDGDAIGNRSVDGLKIVVSGENHLQATIHDAFSCEVPTFIKGWGSLTATANRGDAVCVFRSTLTISDITLKASGQRGIAGHDGRSGEQLFIKKAKVSAKGTQTGIARFAMVFFDGCDVRVPVGGYFDPMQFAIVDSDEKVSEWVEIERTYGLYVADQQVTGANCDALENIVGADVARGGHFYYIPGTKKLYMNGVTVSSKGYRGAIYEDGIGELEIVVSGTNRLKATKVPALRCSNSTTISGGGTLNAVSDDDEAVYVGQTLTISDISLEASGKYGIRGAHATGGETLILKNAKVTAKGTEGAIIKLVDFVTEGCDIIYPVGGKFDKEKHAVIDANGNIANEVRIVPIKDYDLFIAGVRVTHANCDDLSKIDGVSVAEGGEFKYDPDTNTLTMKDVSVSVGDDKNAIENKGIEGLKIKISGTNRLESTNYSSLYCGVTTNISGEGTLTTVGSKNANGVGTYVKTTLTISDITLEASGKWGIAGQDGNQNETLILKNAKVIAEGSVAGIADLASLTLEGCKMVAPVDGKFDKEQHAVVDAQGNKAKEVKIEPFVKYQLYIAGTQVTELNYNALKDIKGVTVAQGGEFKYDPATNTLTMKDVTVSGVISTSVAGLRIIVSGANRLESKAWGTFASGAATFIEGDGSLTATNSSASSILVAESTLTISDITVEASGKLFGIVGFSGKGEHLVLNHTKLTAKSDDNGAIKGFESLTLDACKIVAPVGGKFNAAEHAVVDAEGKDAKEVKIERAAPVAVTGVKVTPTTVNLKVKETQQLIVTVEPDEAANKNYTCESNNESVATVDKLGFIKAVGAGTAIITITTVDGHKKAQCTVNVEKNGGSTPPADVTGVTLAYSDLTLKIGTSLRLVAKIEPANATNKAVTWSSDNDAVATVSDAGLVEAKTVGKATIKVITQDGGHTATCSFTVTAEDVVLTGLKVSSAELHIEVGQTSNLYVSYEPADATHRAVTWETSDAAIVTVDANGSLQGVAVGEATVTVTSKINPSIKATCKVIVKPATAVEDVVFANVVVAPNPFNNELRIVGGDLRGKYALYNTQGVVVTSGVLEGTETRINTSSFPVGMYLLRLSAESGTTKTYRVVKQ